MGLSNANQEYKRNRKFPSEQRRVRRAREQRHVKTLRLDVDAVHSFRQAGHHHRTRESGKESALFAG